MSETPPPSIPPRKKSSTVSTSAPGSEHSGSSATPSAAPSVSRPTGTARTASAPAKLPARGPATVTSARPATAAATATRAPAATASAPTAEPVTTAPPQGQSVPIATVTPTSDPTGQPAAPATTPRQPVPERAAVTTQAGPRRVRLAVSRVDPWSVMKLSFLLSVAVGIMIVVATAVVWLTLDQLEVFASIDQLATEVLADSDIDLLDYVAFDRVLSAATLVAVVDVLLITALSTIGAFLYNITASLVGGISLTLTDD
ncbi:DUF3566 domain-containing protein [Cellulomonas hominis]